MKTLKDFLEVYEPRAPDEKKFVDKHVTIKHKDRNEVNGKANGDDVFNASNIKPIKRKENRQGYDVGEDEKVYEEAELEEAALKQAEDRHFEKQSPKMQTAINLHLRKGKDYQDAVAAARRHVKEEVEDLDIDALLDEALAILEKTLTPAELKKREEIAKAMERENPGMSMSKKMAIATAQAKKVAEEVEEIDESAKVVDHLIKRYGDNVRKSHVMSAANDFGVGYTGLSRMVRKRLGVTRLEEENDDGWYTHNEMHGKVSKENWKKGWRYNNLKDKPFYHQPTKTWHASVKNIKEEVEAIDELSKGAMLKYLSANKKSDAAAQAKGDYSKSVKRMRGTDIAVRKYTASPNSKYVRVPATEEVDLDEGLMHDRYMRSHGKKARGTGGWAFTTKQYGSPKEKDMHFTSGSKSLSDAHKEAAAKLGTKNLYVMEEVEQIDELSIKTLEKYKNAARNDAYIAYHGDDDNRRLLKRTKGIKTATKKIRSNFVKGVDEAFEQIDEAINFTALDAVTKGHDGKSYSAMFDAHGSSIHNKIKAVRAERDNQPGKTSHATFLHDKMLKAYASWYKNKKDVKEESEVPFEGPYKKTGTVRKDEYGNVIQNVPRHLAKQAMKALTKEDIINRAVDKYIPEELKFTAEERMIKRLEGLREDHIQILMSLFESLNDTNQAKMIESAETEEGLNQLLDFAINNRGE